MAQQDFNCSITVDLSASEAIRRISNVSDWWGINFSGSAHEQGDTFVVKMGGESYFNFTVTEVVADKRIVWEVTDCYMPWYPDKHEWTGTSLIFDLSEKESATLITFTHEGLTPELDCYQDCETGWTHWIRTSLFSYLTTGQGRLKTKINVTYSTSIEVAVSAEDAFRRINDVSTWWPEEFEGKSSELNDEFTFGAGQIHSSTQRVVELIENKKVAWLTTESLRKTDNYNWTGAIMTFELTPKDGVTVIHYTYAGPVFENEYDRLVQVCDRVLKEWLSNAIIGMDVK